MRRTSLSPMQLCSFAAIFTADAGGAPLHEYYSTYTRSRCTLPHPMGACKFATGECHESMAWPSIAHSSGSCYVNVTVCCAIVQTLPEIHKRV